MQPLTLKVTGALVYLTGACASYVDINSKVIHAPILATKSQNLGQTIISCTQASYHHARDYYHTRVNPVVYSATWPIIQFTIVSTSIFTGTLCGTLEWHNKTRA